MILFNSTHHALKNHFEQRVYFEKGKIAVNG
uniref:Uncharacterized protein n=1 Tax=Tetranychus urticae TaxID=32264 RepID=T1L4B3_TETUR